MPNIRVINLARSTARREKFAGLNRHLETSFFDAVDGAKLTEQAIRDSGLFAADIGYTPGAYGCAMSHLSLWEEAIRTDQVVTVAEDDAIFRLDFEQQYAAALAQLPPDWDIVIWGWNLDYVLSLSFMPGISPAVAFFDQEQMRRSVKEFQFFQEKPNLLRLDKCWGIPAYSISPRGARRLKERCFPLRHFDLRVPITQARLGNTGIDSAMNAAYADMHAYVAFPPLVITENDTANSTIQQVRQKSFLSRKFKAFKQQVRTLFRRKARIDPTRLR